ncbi:MAG: isoprenylcysteine carboxylmethyltransferase family protein [Hyphomicrobiales bacterium]|nr:isoprenylcysteine carboxylmethyltransferase family protein [Hyphomicrobiales bacterium]MCP5370246.1 isoprenylcysteine carboxylmethyltransferase family protein [Hyphomicrobiales bacterium]
MSTLEATVLDTPSDSLVPVRAGSPSRLARAGVFAYGVTAYAVGMAPLVWMALWMFGLLPVGFVPLAGESTAAALAINLVLVALFAVQHSIMARRSFKRRLTRVIPEAAERSTFVLATGVCLALALALWQTVPGTVWSVDAPALQVVLYAISAFGWLFLVASTFAINHFDLFGLRQVWLYLAARPYTPVKFVSRWMYRYIRHPLMTGIFLGMWATPHMTVDHLVMAAVMTLYVLIGVHHEEKDLRRQFGDTYDAYTRRVGKFLPRLSRA